MSGELFGGLARPRAAATESLARVGGDAAQGLAGPGPREGPALGARRSGPAGDAPVQAGRHGVDVRFSSRERRCRLRTARSLAGQEVAQVAVAGLVRDAGIPLVRRFDRGIHRRAEQSAVRVPGMFEEPGGCVTARYLVGRPGGERVVACTADTSISRRLRLLRPDETTRCPRGEGCSVLSDAAVPAAWRMSYCEDTVEDPRAAGDGTPLRHRLGRRQDSLGG